MFNPFKKLFGRRAEGTTEDFREVRIQAPAQPATATFPTAARRVDNQPGLPRAESPRQQVIAQQAAIGSTLSLPLRAVLGRLPAELMSRVRDMDVGEAEVFVPMQKVLSQLPQGAVRISFGELRQASPPGTFSPENDRDRTLVELPLNEILTRVNPSLLARRAVQRHIEVPAEVVGPFGGQNHVTVAATGAAPLHPAAAAPIKHYAQPAAAPAPAAHAPAPVAVPEQPIVFNRPHAPAVPAAKPLPQTQSPVYSPIAPAPARAPQAVPMPGQPAFKRAAAPASPPIQPVHSPIAPTPVPPRGAPVPPMSPVFNRAPQPAAPVRPAAPAEQPIFRRAAAPAAPAVRPLQPSTAPTLRPPQAPVAVPEEPIFRRAPAPTVAPPPAPPVYTPIAPEPEAQPEPISFPVAEAIPGPMEETPAPEPEAIPAPELQQEEPTVLSAPEPVALPTPPPEPEPIRFNPSFTPPPTATQPRTAPAPAPAPIASAARETIFLTIALTELYDAWPDAIKQEIATLNLTSASAALPQGLIEASIKQGRVIFPWKLIRSWIKPPVSPAHVSPHDALLLELPLKVVTPVFLASLRTVRTQKKVAIDAAIPNIFSGTASQDAAAVPPTAAAPSRPVGMPAPPRPPTPTPASAPAPAPVQTGPVAAPDTNYYVWKDSDEHPAEAAPVVKKGPSPGTSFLQRYATPNEIVSKAAALSGVGGALIALPDGLLVASKIPPDLNADTLAAFLPQIFARVSQTTRELRMGELNNLNFTVGLIPWKIFRVGAIYFAAFGVAGQPLPTAQLAGIAAELDRKAK